MTTKEEVLRLAEEADIDTTGRCGKRGVNFHGIDHTDKITKLIELAKQAGTKEERQRWNVNMRDWQYIFSRSCQRAHPHEEMNDECQEITKRLRAIRNRESKS